MEERRELERKTKEELKQLAQGLEIAKTSALKKDELIDKILEKLSWREKYIVEQYYGIDKKEEKNLEEIGIDLGITKERVRQIKLAALNKLRTEILLIEGADFIFK